MRRRESRRRSRHNRTSKSPAMWPGFLAAQIVREYSLLLIFLCKIFPEKLDKARGGRRGILDSPFQSTPPRGGATARKALHTAHARNFNPRPPRGGRRRSCRNCSPAQYFNPRPPREGGDDQSTVQRMWNSNFNPRPPRGGRLLAVTSEAVNLPISIHAPREGGDLRWWADADDR